MIEGLKVTVTGHEVAELARKQAAFHAGRAEFYNQQLALYANQLQGAPSLQAYSNQDPRQAAQSKATEHQSKQEHLLFVADHIKVGEDYLLGDRDLKTLGIVKHSGIFM